MRILVTGGAGFIGSHYVQALLSEPMAAAEELSVTVLDSLTYAGNRRNLDSVRSLPGFRFVAGDIADASLADRLLAEHDEVVHFAAESHVDRSISAAAPFVHTNVAGTQTLLDAAVRHGIRVFVQVSTDEVYGSIPSGSWTEDAPLAPNSPYAASKAAADLLALAYHRTHGLDVRITRCSNNYGPRQHPEKVIPLFVTSLLRGESVPLYGDGRNVRDWLHVADHCQGAELVRTGGRAGEIYHIGGGCELTNAELTDRLLGLLGADRSRVRRVPDRKGHDRRYSLDWRKIHRELGYKPRHQFGEGLADTVSWYRDHPGWWDR
jgi:dTDP-glucose 4,6-dehydratase